MEVMRAFVVVKNRLEQTPLQTNLSFKFDTENNTKELLFPHHIS